MIAVFVHADVILAGVAVPPHRTLEVVDDDFIAPHEDEERCVLRAAQARALVAAGYADPIDADFDALPDLIDGWQTA